MPRGQRPKPTAVQIAEGDPRKIGKHKLQEKLESEPQARIGLPRCPSYLKGHARRAWRFWCAELEDMGLNRRPDALMLEGACIAYESAIAAFEAIQKQGRFIPKKARDAAGNWVVVDVKSHPAVAQAKAAWALMKSFCGEFGLSPLSRTRLSVDNPGEAVDDLWELLSKPREHRRPVTEAIQ